MKTLVDDKTLSAVIDAVERFGASQEQQIATLAQAIIEIGGLNFDLLEDATNFIADGGE